MSDVYVVEYKVMKARVDEYIIRNTIDGNDLSTEEDGSE